MESNKHIQSRDFQNIFIWLTYQRAAPIWRRQPALNKLAGVSKKRIDWNDFVFQLVTPSSSEETWVWIEREPMQTLPKKSGDNVVGVRIFYV